MTLSRRILCVVLASAALGLWLSASSLPAAVNEEPALKFDAARFADRTVAVGDQTVAYRAFEDIVYVTRPVDARYQRMNFYVPAAYLEGKVVGAYTAKTAPIFLPNMVGGYMPGEPGTPGLGRDGRPNAIAVALSKGFVVASPGARGRTAKDAAGQYTGKAPACIVDLKAAVRYLRRNDQTMPGNAEKIISNGTSAGGALSALLGASGNSADYAPYLTAIGAADERDDIFAASCYCPITNLDHADAAYEWQFNGVNTYDQRGTKGALTPEQIEVSRRLKALFPAYLNGLDLRPADGSRLHLDANGEGTFKEYVKTFVIASAQRAMKAGTDLSGLAWLKVENGVVTGLDFERFVAHATRLKTPPAFDALDRSSGENSLFGTAATDRLHFTPFAGEDAAGAGQADAAVVKMMNPLNYVGGPGAAATAKHWRIRHGAVDRDTSLAIPVILALQLERHGDDVDFALPWGRGHSGDYDLDELFAWIERISR